MILPYLERSDVYNTLQLSGDPTDPSTFASSYQTSALLPRPRRSRPTSARAIPTACTRTRTTRLPNSP